MSVRLSSNLIINFQNYYHAFTVKRKKWKKKNLTGIDRKLKLTGKNLCRSLFFNRVAGYTCLAKQLRLNASG